MKLVLRSLCLVVLMLTGCDDEPTQRRAFIEFLQTGIVDRTGVHIPIMKPDKAESFGPYAAHYQIILDFNAGFDLAPLERVARLKGQITNLEDFAAHRDDLHALRDALPGLIATLHQRLATANAARVALQQPADLQAVYDKAFDRVVTRPGMLTGKMLDLLPSSVDAMIALADYVADNPKIIRVSGMGGGSQDPDVQRHLADLIEAIHRNDEAADDLKRQFQALLSGT